jgi:hypothetical protein
MNERTEEASGSVNVRLSAISVVATALWMPLTTALVAHLGLLKNPVVLAILVICWIGSALVFWYPYMLEIRRDEVIGTWLGGRTKRWPRASLELSPVWSLPGSAFGARQVKCNGTLAFLVWRLMSHSNAAVATLAAKSLTEV